jgi:hypothetical protein
MTGQTGPNPTGTGPTPTHAGPQPDPQPGTGAAPAPADPEPTALAGAAARLEEVAPGYLDLVRRRAAELAVPTTRQERARRAAQLVARSVETDPALPMSPSRRPGAVAKRAAAVLSRFVVYTVGQVRGLGESTALMGTELCDYVAELEGEIAELRERVGRLEERRSDP